MNTLAAVLARRDGQQRKRERLAALREDRDAFDEPYEPPGCGARSELRPDLIARAERLIRGGMTYKAAANEIGCNRATLAKHLPGLRP